MFTIIPKKPSRPVESWLQVKDQALKTVEFMRKHTHPNGRRHLALHHAQISKDPLNFFVVPQDPDNLLLPMMVIMNLKITGKENPVNHTEACMSFPFRPAKNVRRYSTIIASFDEYSERDGLVHRSDEKVEGLLAYIFQHEAQHARGEHIYL